MKWTKEKDLTLNTQLEHEKGQKKKIQLQIPNLNIIASGRKKKVLSCIFARSAKKILILNTQVKHER